MLSDVVLLPSFPYAVSSLTTFHFHLTDRCQPPTSGSTHLHLRLLTIFSSSLLTVDFIVKAIIHRNSKRCTQPELPPQTLESFYFVFLIIQSHLYHITVRAGFWLFRKCYYHVSITRFRLMHSLLYMQYLYSCAEILHCYSFGTVMREAVIKKENKRKDTVRDYCLSLL